MTMTRCDGCPLGRRCRPVFCEWFHSGDPIKRAHVVNLGAIREGRGVTTFPPLVTQAKNLAGSVARFARSGGAVASPEEQDRRLSICRTCEHFDVGPPGRCRKCGCVASLKTRIEADHCPLDPPKW